MNKKIESAIHVAQCALMGAVLVSTMSVVFTVAIAGIAIGAVRSRLPQGKKTTGDYKSGKVLVEELKDELEQQD